MFVLILFTLLFGSESNAGFCDDMKEDAHRICYMSLNNTKEYEAFKKKYAKTNTVEVFELMTSATDPMKSIKENFNALSSCGKKPPCNSIVVGGHQNGSFWGDLVEGEVTPADLLLMQCSNPQIKDVSTVWLQGCNTIDEDIEQQKYDPQIYNKEDALFDFSELKRTLEKFKSENNTANSTNHNDRKNFHVTNAYSAAFPKALVHGWEGIAPGVSSGSAKSMILHLQQTIEFLLEAGIDAKTFDEANKYLLARKAQLEGKGMSKEINRDFFREGDFLTILQEDLSKILSGQQYRCVWEIYQKKYFGTEGVDLRRPKSVASAYQRGYPRRHNICDTKRLVDKHINLTERNAKEFKAEMQSDIEKQIDKMFHSDKGIDENLIALEAMLDKFDDDIPEFRKRKKMWQDVLRKNSKIKSHIVSLLDEEGITLSRRLELINLYENLTGVSVTAGDKDNPIGLIYRGIEDSNLNKSIEKDLEETLGEYNRIKKSEKLKDAKDELRKIPTEKEILRKRGISSSSYSEELAWCYQAERTLEEKESNDCKARFDAEAEIQKREEQEQKVAQISEGNTSQILDFGKLIEEAAEGGRISKKTWKVIEENLDNMPDYLRKRILYIASKDKKRRVGASLSKKAKAQVQATRRRKTSPGISIILKEEQEEAWKKEREDMEERRKEQRRKEREEEEKKVNPAPTTRAPEQKQEDRPEMTSRTGGATTKPRVPEKVFSCKPKSNYRLNRKEFRDCNDLAGSTEPNGFLITCLEKGKFEGNQSFDASRNRCIGLCENLYYGHHEVKRSVGPKDVNLRKICERGYYKSGRCLRYKSSRVYKEGGKLLLGYTGYSCHSAATNTNYMCQKGQVTARKVECKTFQCAVGKKASSLSKDICTSLRSERDCKSYLACEWNNQ